MGKEVANILNTLIIRGKVVTPTQVIFPGELIVSQGRIRKIGKSISSSTKQGEILDFGGDIVLPGFVDIHLHGLAEYGPTGRDILGIASLEPQYGTTAFLPSLASATHQEFLCFLEDIMKSMADREAGQARVLGAHLEGPCINPLMKGGMDEKYLRLPDPGEYKELIEKGRNCLKMMTLSRTSWFSGFNQSSERKPNGCFLRSFGCNSGGPQESSRGWTEPCLPSL